MIFTSKVIVIKLPYTVYQTNKTNDLNAKAYPENAVPKSIAAVAIEPTIGGTAFG